jgi:hypothetical protein
VTRHAFAVRAGDGAEIVCTAHEPIGRVRSTIAIAPNGPLPRAGPFRSMTRLADLLCDAYYPEGEPFDFDFLVERINAEAQPAVA